MIETKEFEISKQNYFRLMFKNQLIMCIWILLYVCVLVSAFQGVYYGEWIAVELFVIFMAVCCFSLAFFRAGSFVYYKENASFFQKRTMRFDGESLSINCEDGAHAKLPLSHVSLALLRFGYYLVFISKYHYYVIPKNAFQSEEDRIRFETDILGAKFQKTWWFWSWLAWLLIVSAICFGLAFYAKSTKENEQNTETTAGKEVVLNRMDGIKRCSTVNALRSFSAFVSK